MIGRTPAPMPRVDPTTAYRRPAAAPGTLALDANEGAPPDPALLAALAAADPEVMRRYPRSDGLERVLADRLTVPVERLLVTAGAGDALDRACRAYLTPGAGVVLADPTFEMLDRYVGVAWGRPRRIPWATGPFPLDGFLAAGRRHRPALIVVVSPNNPTGAVATLEDVRALATAAPRALVVLDHAYVEFADADLTADVRDLDNVLVVRTLSKAWGLAGCRVGYALAAPAVLAALRAAGPSYPLAGPSLALAAARLAQGDDPMRAYVTTVRAERDALAHWARSLGLAPRPSQGNFVLVDCGARAAALARVLDLQGVRVRRFPDRVGLGEALRITLPGNAADFHRLTTALGIAVARTSREPGAEP